MLRVTFLYPPVIEPGGARVGVACERHALAEQVGDDGGAEGVGRTRRGREPSLRRPLHHVADVVGVEGVVGELADLADRRVGQRGIVGCLLQACRLEVVSEGLLQVAPAGDLAGKAVALAGVLGRGTRAWGNGRGWWSRGPPQDSE